MELGRAWGPRAQAGDTAEEGGEVCGTTGDDRSAERVNAVAVSTPPWPLLTYLVQRRAPAASQSPCPPPPCRGTRKTAGKGHSVHMMAIMREGGGGW